MKEEFLIERKFGRTKPFRTPDGYFEEFEKSIMLKIPSQPKTAKSLSIRRYLRLTACAACIAAVMVSTLFFLGNIHTNPEKHVANASLDSGSLQTNSDYIMDEMSDYAMLDNDDFYSFIADE